VSEMQAMCGINLFSDTQTLPTDLMRQAMMDAEVGDDVYGQDPTVRRLEERLAGEVAKECALFVPSGHMGNLVCVMAHCKAGDEVIVEETSHLYSAESGSLAAIAHVMPRIVRGRDGLLDGADVRAVLRCDDIHYPRTTLLCIENPHNAGGGAVLSLPELRDLSVAAKEHGLAVHLDGARLFNAAAALNVAAADICESADSVMVCLSKGLSAPAGSVVAGSRAFIAEARRARKLLGGGMRQVGVLAAAGLVGLDTMMDQLRADNENARLLAESLAKLPGHRVEWSRVRTNIVNANVEGLQLSSDEYVAKLAEHGILASKRPPHVVRFVTNRHVDREDIGRVIEVAKRIGRAACG